MAKLHELTLETLGKMDGGRIATAFGLALKRCIQDCEDRPNVNKPREITIKLGVLPAAGPEDDVCDRVRMQSRVNKPSVGLLARGKSLAPFWTLAPVVFITQCVTEPPSVTPPFQIDRIGGFGSRNC